MQSTLEVLNSNKQKRSESRIYVRRKTEEWLGQDNRSSRRCLEIPVIKRRDSVKELTYGHQFRIENKNATPRVHYKQ